jgi:methylthioribulose-1-phosphate dehydratase
MSLTFSSASHEILSVGRRLDARGLAPATTGNYSVRLDNGHIAVTVSGRHKGRLVADDVTQIDLDGRALGTQAPSAEAVLHAALYRLYETIHAVLHVHSVASITLSRLLPRGSDVLLQGHETLKVLPGVTTHDTQVVIPVFDNSQDMPALVREVVPRLKMLEPRPAALLLRGHGLYAWGASVEEAERVVEGLELMMSCELETLRVGRT